MFPLPVSCRVFLPALLAGAVLAVAVPANAVAAARPSTPPPAIPMEWLRDHTPTQFRQLAAAGEPIDPVDVDEPLLAAAIFQETNQRRADLGLPAFLPDEKAFAAARLHAGWMAGNRRLSHDEPSGHRSPVTALDRLMRQGLRPHLTAENIAFNLLPDITPGKLFYTRLSNGRPIYSYQPGGPPLRMNSYDGFARTILAQWMRSPPHRAHIVDPGLRFMGVGVALAHRRRHPDTLYVAQDFFTPHVLPSASASGSQSASATRIPSRP